MTHIKEAIVNHETNPDALLPIRKYGYVLGALKKLRKQKIEPDFAYFVTWQSGDKIPEGHPKSLCDYFKNPELARKLLLEDDVIVAQEVPDEKLLESGEASLLLIFMKYARSPEFLDWLKEHKEVAEQFAEHKYIDRAVTHLLNRNFMILRNISSVIRAKNVLGLSNRVKISCFVCSHIT